MPPGISLDGVSSTYSSLKRKSLADPFDSFGPKVNIHYRLAALLNTLVLSRQVRPATAVHQN